MLVIKALEPVRSNRLALGESTSRALKKGANLLEIDVPERM
ncbi:hypothetical protein JIN84_07380 [Luteolibacter yonseiensis]|uniref:DALR anticodon binding domain-containing protein n=1 Tax=Luteolibacter yonseiensis TaxID=1144680 RepID=A0A934R248_9BACT|nr:DALR anticodon-binding domain-containing protein [Luteolibacter yonseiensis]MBK1815429.1 hypothetical protein [Luteolibacter yonseiensis]